MAKMTYKNISKSTNLRADTGGYKNVVYMSPRSAFLSIAKPVSVPTALGEGVTITSAHTFTDPAGFITWECKTASVTGKATTVGEDGSGEIEYTYTFVIIGDSATTQEQMQTSINDDIIWMLKEANCLVDDSYVQLGDECNPAQAKVDADFKTTKEGKKEWTVTVVSKARYFYTAVVTLSTEVES
jgi:hypothetical protein